MNREPCRSVNLAANPAARVDLCSCGCVHLDIGPVRLRLAPDVLPKVAEVLGVAIERLGRGVAEKGRGSASAGGMVRLVGWYARRDSNPRHPPCKGGALTS